MKYRLNLIFDLPSFIEKTLSLIHSRENINSFFKKGDANCRECTEERDSFIINVETEKLAGYRQVVEMSEVIQMALLKRNQNRKCHHQDISLENMQDLCIIIKNLSEFSITFEGLLSWTL